MLAAVMPIERAKVQKYPVANRFVQYCLMVGMCLHSVLVVAFGPLIVIIISGRSILGTLWLLEDWAALFLLISTPT